MPVPISERKEFGHVPARKSDLAGCAFGGLIFSSEDAKTLNRAVGNRERICAFIPRIETLSARWRRMLCAHCNDFVKNAPAKFDIFTICDWRSAKAGKSAKRFEICPARGVRMIFSGVKSSQAVVNHQVMRNRSQHDEHVEYFMTSESRIVASRPFHGIRDAAYGI